MARASKLFSVAVAVVILAIAVLAVVLRGQLRCAGFAGPAVTAGELPPPAEAGELRVATWNVRNFPLDERPQQRDLAYSRRTNICDLQTALEGLGADLFGFAEIRDSRRFPPILRRAGAGRQLQVVFSRSGGRFGQRLAIAWDDEVLELVDGPVEITELVLERGMRPALAARFAVRASEDTGFTVVQVHLEATRGGYRNRVRQLRALADWVERWTAEVRDADVILMGDFNLVGPPWGTPEGERAEADALFASAGLARVPNTDECTQYWEGFGDRDGIQQPSLLDLVYVGGSLRRDGPMSAKSWLHCARAGCRELVSRPGEEDGSFWDVSDHCPVTFELSIAEVTG
jgi:endonuclease/exonuclease/phosphatase family metal-dependent hydrolase